MNFFRNFFGKHKKITPLEETKKPIAAAAPNSSHLAVPPTSPPKFRPKSKSALRFSIGTKFLFVILATLSVAILVTVLNATQLFEKDNLNNIYVASDLLTEAKSAEVRSWINSLIQKGNVIGKVLVSDSKGDEKTNSQEVLLKTLESDTDLLAVAVYRKKANREFSQTQSWQNSVLHRQIKFPETAAQEVFTTAALPFSRIASGVIHATSYILATGQPLFVLSLPFIQESPGQFSGIVTLIARQDRLLESFGNSGFYTLSLVDDRGGLIAHPEIERVRGHENLKTFPIVKRMLESSLEREFQEFTFGKVKYLGAYAKVGIAGLGVVSQVPRSHAFEAGQILIRRSVLTAVIVLSIAFLVAFLMSQTLTAPIRKLNEATRAIAKGNFKIRVQNTTTDEIADLGVAFNAMGEEIDRKIQNLSEINESSKVISSTLETTRLLEFATDTLVSLLRVKNGVSWLWAADPTQAGWEPKNFKGVFKKGDDNLIGRFDKLTLSKMKAVTQPSVVESTASFLVVPVREKTGIVGYVVLHEKISGLKFEDEDVFIAGTVITNVGITLENIRLLEATADNARMEKELETARWVQETMFPPASLVVSGVEIESYFKPASECGGDWWGTCELPGGRILLAVGDATGHGVPAALVTATAKSACSVIHGVSSALPNLRFTPSNILYLMNKSVHESTQGKVLMTFFVAILDTTTGEVTYATASHDPVYWMKSDPNAELEALLVKPGPRLGQNAEAEYEDGKIQLGASDKLVLYTDGLTEGLNSTSEEYGERRFLRSLKKHSASEVVSMRDSLLADFSKFTGDEPLHDDVSLVVCKYNGNGQGVVNV